MPVRHVMKYISDHPHQIANRQMYNCYSLLKPTLAEDLSLGCIEPGHHTRTAGNTIALIPQHHMTGCTCKFVWIELQCRKNSCEHYTVPCNVVLFLFKYLYCIYDCIILSLYTVCIFIHFLSVIHT